MSDPVARYLAVRDTATAPPAGALDPVSAYLMGNPSPTPAPVAPPPQSLLSKILGELTNIGGAIPGGKLAQSGYAMIGNLLAGQPIPETAAQGYHQVAQTQQYLPAAAKFANAVAGGAAALPLLAASPVLAGAELGGADMALAPTDESLGQRATNTVLGAGAGGLAGGVAHAITGLGGLVAPRFVPSLAVRAAARSLLEPGDVAEMAKTAAAAPGGVSVATSAVPNTGIETSRFLPLIRGIGKNPAAAMMAEHDVLGQQNALDASERALGARMDQITGGVPMTLKLAKALESAQELLGKKAPIAETEVRQLAGYPATERLAATSAFPAPPEVASGLPTSLREAINAFHERSAVAAARGAGTTAQQSARAMLERHSGEAALPATSSVQGAILHEPAPGMPDRTAVTQSVPIQDLRDALSRLRFHMRALESRGPNAPGVTTRDYANAIRQMTDVVYEHAPVFATLDRPYAMVQGQQRAAQDVLEAIQRSRANYAATSAYGQNSESLGASIHGRPSLYAHLHNILTNPAGAARAVEQLIVRPSGPEAMQSLLQPPLTTPAALARYSLLGLNPVVPHP